MREGSGLYQSTKVVGFKAQTPVTVIDLKSVTRLSGIDQERETFLPNAFVLDTQKDGSYQLCADNNKDRQTIFTALQTVTQTK